MTFFDTSLRAYSYVSKKLVVVFGDVLSCIADRSSADDWPGGRSYLSRLAFSRGAD